MNGFAAHVLQCEDAGEKQVLLTVLAKFLYQQAAHGLINMFVEPTVLLKDTVFKTVHVMALRGLSDAADSLSSFAADLPSDAGVAFRQVADKAHNEAKKFAPKKP